MKIKDINSKDYNIKKNAISELIDELDEYRKLQTVETCIEVTERVSAALGIDIKLSEGE